MRGARTVCFAWVLATVTGLGSGVFAQDLDRARALLTAGERDQARALLDSTLASSLKSADHDEAMYLRAIASSEGEDYETRVRELAELDNTQDRLGWIYFTLGQLAYARGSMKVAAREFQRAQKYGRMEDGSLWEGLAAFVLGQTDVALDALQRGANSGNSRIRHRAMMALGDARRASGDWSEAQSDYKRLRDDDRVSAGWWAAATYREAECWAHLDKPERAGDLFRNLLEQTPSAYEAPLARAKLAAMTATGGLVEPAGTGTEPRTESEDPAPEMFSVQVGAFSAGENAEVLAAQVRDHGFPAVRVIKGSDLLFRVLVGKETLRQGAESLGDSLGTTLGLGYSVVREASP